MGKQYKNVGYINKSRGNVVWYIFMSFNWIVCAWFSFRFIRFSKVENHLGTALWLIHELIVYRYYIYIYTIILWKKYFLLYVRCGLFKKIKLKENGENVADVKAFLYLHFIFFVPFNLQKDIWWIENGIFLKCKFKLFFAKPIT